MTSSLLKKLGYSYDIAKSGEEALDKFSDEIYSVIIMDIQMPGMNGLETSKHIRNIEKNKKMRIVTPILAITGYATADDSLLCRKAGMNDCLSKPFELNELKKKLLKIMPENK